MAKRVKMNDESQQKRKMSKWIKVPLVTFGTLFVLNYAYMQLIIRDGKASPFTGPVVQIASGTYSLYGNNDDFGWDRPAPPTISREPACSRYSGKAEPQLNVEYSTCTTLFSGSKGPGCALWRFEFCNVYHVDDFILTQPELLGRILHALKDPCVYLPTVEELQKAREQGFSTRELERRVEVYSCATGGTPVPFKVVINVENDQGEVIAQYKHLPKDRSLWTFFTGL